MTTLSHIEPLPLEEQRRLCLCAFYDAAENGEEDLVLFLVHAGITYEEVQAVEGDITTAILRHYLTPSGYAWERVADSLLTYPPVQGRLRELQDEKRSAAAKDRSRKALKRLSARVN